MKTDVRDILYDYQKDVIEKLESGSVLVGGVGSGKTLTSLVWYHDMACSSMNNPKDLYVITTAKKRDSMEWELDGNKIKLTSDKALSPYGVSMTVDSWNNIDKYINIKNCVFIFDEQHITGKGPWVRAFMRIAKYNDWIVVTATPGDKWIEYMPLFIANGFYKNRMDFYTKHVVWNRFTTYPSIDKYINCDLLIQNKDRLLVKMDYESRFEKHVELLYTDYDRSTYDCIIKRRWDPFEMKPLENLSQVNYLLKKASYSHLDKTNHMLDIIKAHKKVIAFYRYNYELEELRSLRVFLKNTKIAELNGMNHDPIPDTDSWLYLVQYNSGSEAWNCVVTNCMVFYSVDYSYKAMVQAAGRIDRVNSKFDELYYYVLVSRAKIDADILECLKNKKEFNMDTYDANS